MKLGSLFRHELNIYLNSENIIRSFYKFLTNQLASQQLSLKNVTNQLKTLISLFTIIRYLQLQNVKTPSKFCSDYEPCLLIS
jgi:hypothetical protein